MKRQGKWGLYDVGIYNIECVLDFMQAMPNEIHVYSEKKYGVDVYDKIELIFPSTKAILEMAIDRNQEKALMIQGTKQHFMQHRFIVLPLHNIYARWESKNVYKKNINTMIFMVK